MKNTMNSKLKAPFPYFGGKSTVAADAAYDAACAVYTADAVRAADAAARAAYGAVRAAYAARVAAKSAQIKMIAEMGNPFRKERVE